MKLSGFRPSPALVVALIALFVSIGGIGYAASKIGTNDIKNGAVTAQKLHKNAVTTKKIKNQAVTGGKFFLSSVTTLNFGNVNGSTCSAMTIPAPGISASDHVVVTPPPGWPDTFVLTAHPEPASNAARFTACNTFTGGGFVDPDGASGGPYKLLVIR